MKHRFVGEVLSLALLLAPVSLFAETDAPIDFPGVDSFLRETVARYRIPGLAIAIVDDGGVLYSAGFGEATKGVPITPETPFLLGSTTKTFTALAVLRLAESGKISLDDPVTDYLSELTVAQPGFAERITIRHLLNHTSGLTASGMPGATTGEKSLAAEIVALRKCVPSSEPGLAYRYFNGNYRVLGAVIERVSGMDYPAFLRSAVFDPLSMSFSTGTPETVEGIAEGHGEIFGIPIRRTQSFRAGALPSGYIVSSAADVSRLLVDELRAANAGNSVLSPALVAESWTPPEGGPAGYAMGWLPMTDSSGNRFVIHGGSLENYQSFFYLAPERKIGFVILMSQGGLIPMAGGFNTTRDGLIKIVGGEKPDRGSVMISIAILATIAAAIFVLEIFLSIRLWKRNATAQRIGLKRGLPGILGEIAVVLFPAYIVPLANAVMGEKVGWSMIWGLISTEFVVIVVMAAVFSLARLIYRIYLYAAKN